MILHPPKEGKDGDGENEAEQKDAMSVKTIIHHGDTALR
jgi:hypothetical protein